MFIKLYIQNIFLSHIVNIVSEHLIHSSIWHAQVLIISTLWKLFLIICQCTVTVTHHLPYMLQKNLINALKSISVEIIAYCYFLHRRFLLPHSLFIIHYIHLKCFQKNRIMRFKTLNLNFFTFSEDERLTKRVILILIPLVMQN